MPHFTERDTFQLSAAWGWLELGNHLEANKELDQINPEFKNHPEVLNVRWAIYARAEKWDACLEIAQALMLYAGNRPFAWIVQSVSLLWVSHGSVQAAYYTLRPAARRFPEELSIPFNLARFGSQLGKMKASYKWLARAFIIAKKNGQIRQLKSMTLEDPDLKPLWKAARKRKFFVSLLTEK